MKKSHIALPDKTIGLLLVGGLHHIFHLVPIVAGLEKIDTLKTVIYVRSIAEKEACARLLKGLAVGSIDIKILESRPLAKRLSPKLSFLLGHLKIWKKLDAIIVVERTSTILRYISRKLPPLIHIPHGAGDRAKSYDSRIRHFDHVLVAGEKDKNRMISLGLVTPENCHVTGYIKPYAVKQLNPNRPSFFNNANPTVLYNPHFATKLSSWTEFGKPLLDAFAKHKDFNFIVAPHIRLFSKAEDTEKAAILAFEEFDNIHVDLGSEQSTDMSYTRAADIYLGDVSSQVYEFLSEPKPCIFIANADVNWQGNPDYAHWRYGPVCHSAAEVMTALNEAAQTLPNYAKAQAEGCRAAKGDPDWNPIERAARIVSDILNHP